MKDTEGASVKRKLSGKNTEGCKGLFNLPIASLFLLILGGGIFRNIFIGGYLWKKSKEPPLYEKHLESNGKMIEFAGWMMPVEYSGILPEHHAVRNAAGIFDVSHMGEVEVKGTEAEAFVQHLVTNNVAIMENNQIIYCMMCYPSRWSCRRFVGL